MQSLPRLCLLLLMMLILPVQNLAASLLVEPPCSMAGPMSAMDDCCDHAGMHGKGMLCADMAKCSSTGLPLAATQSLRNTALPAVTPAIHPRIAEPLSPAVLAPWRPPRA
jgi:hypothetical protein